MVLQAREGYDSIALVVGSKGIKAKKVRKTTTKTILFSIK